MPTTVPTVIAPNPELVCALPFAETVPSGLRARPFGFVAIQPLSRTLELPTPMLPAPPATTVISEYSTPLLLDNVLFAPRLLAVLVIRRLASEKVTPDAAPLVS